MVFVFQSFDSHVNRQTVMWPKNHLQDILFISQINIYKSIQKQENTGYNISKLQIVFKLNILLHATSVPQF